MHWCAAQADSGLVPLFLRLPVSLAPATWPVRKT